MKTIYKNWIVQTFLIIVAAVLWKVWLLSQNAFPFNSDEAIIALMAKHILQGELPLFFYGQAYMGSLDAILTAGLFSLFGQQVLMIRVLQIILYVFTILTTALIGRKIFNCEKASVIAAALLAIPAVNATLYTTISLGGYGEALLIGNLLLLIGMDILNVLQNGDLSKVNLPKFRMLVLLWGFLLGFGLWVIGVTLLFGIPVFLGFCIFIFLRWKEWRRADLFMLVIFLAIGGLVGISPIIIFGFQEGWVNLLSEFFGSAVAVENSGFLNRTGSHLINLLFLGIPALLGFRPSWEMRWLILPLIPVILFIWVWVIWFSGKKIKPEWRENKSFGLYLLFGIILLNIVGFILTSFGLDPSGRYFLPMIVPLALLAGFTFSKAKVKRIFKVVILLVVLVYHLIGTLSCLKTIPPGITTQFFSITILDHSVDQELIDFLIDQDEPYGYSNYWVAYPIAFQSDEEVIFVPRLPYHLDFRYTERDSRIEEYEERVAESEKAAFITTNNPGLDEYLTIQFERLEISWKYKEIANYHIFYDLSERVFPQDIDLGETR